MKTTGSKRRFEFRPLTPDRWDDVEKLFGPRGACGGCWCMYWRLRHADFARGKGAANKRAFQKLVRAGGAPGILAYAAGVPIAWCAVAPRHDYTVLERRAYFRPSTRRRSGPSPASSWTRSTAGKV
jgi:hypothetical protein